MKKIVIIMSTLFLGHLIKSDGIYLWQYAQYGQLSCCLHIGNEDICNPNVACTRNIQHDLLGIYDYIDRILRMEKIATFPYAKFLNEAQAYIRKMAWPGSGLSYRFDEHRLRVKFFHDIALEQTLSKNEKSKPAAPMTDAEKTKQRQEEIFDYLVKIGLASRVKQNNKRSVT